MFDIARQGSEIVLRIEPDVADLLRRLNLEFRHLLDKAPEGDAAYERLFPRAYDDQEHEQSYLELVRTDLERAKERAAQDVSDSLGERGAVETRLAPAYLHSWLTWLTDVRLTIGARVGVTQEMMEREPDVDDPRAGALAVMDLLAWLQESLLEKADP